MRGEEATETRSQRESIKHIGPPAGLEKFTGTSVQSGNEKNLKPLLVQRWCAINKAWLCCVGYLEMKLFCLYSERIKLPQQIDYRLRDQNDRL